MNFLRLGLWLCLLILSGPIEANQGVRVLLPSAEAHFRFAGVYAAYKLGWYQKAHLHVELIHQAEVHPVQEVLAARVDFSFMDSRLLWYRLHNKPVVALASIFQRSPYILLGLQDAEKDLALRLQQGHSLPLARDLYPLELALILRQANLLQTPILDQLQTTYQPLSTPGWQALISQQTQVIPAWISDAPYRLLQHNAQAQVWQPPVLDTPLYADTLFTSERFLQRSPQAVQAFREVTLQGWHYAVANPEQVIDWLLQDAPFLVQRSREHLRYEAAHLIPLMQLGWHQIGETQAKHWAQIAREYQSLGWVQDQDLQALQGFVVSQQADLEQKIWVRLRPWIFASALCGLLLLLLLLYVLQANYRLRCEMRRRRDVEEALRQQAQSDSLTGIYNRGFFLERCRHQLQAWREQAPEEALGVLVMVDLDHFKAINDAYGHPVGDEVIRKVARQLQQALQPHELVGRLGGEEFGLLLSVKHLDEAVRWLHAQQYQLKTDPLQLEGQSITISFSAGVVAVESQSLANLLKAADDALYQAKRHGRDRVEIFSRTALE